MVPVGCQIGSISPYNLLTIYIDLYYQKWGREYFFEKFNQSIPFKFKIQK